MKCHEQGASAQVNVFDRPVAHFRVRATRRRIVGFVLALLLGLPLAFSEPLAGIDKANADEPLSSAQALELAQQVIRKGYTNYDEQVPKLIEAARIARDRKDGVVLPEIMTALQTVRPSDHQAVLDLAIELSHLGFASTPETEWDKARNPVVNRSIMILCRVGTDKALAALYDLALSLAPPKESYFASSDVRASFIEDEFYSMTVTTASSVSLLLPPAKAVEFERNVIDHYSKTDYAQNERLMTALRNSLQYAQDVLSRDPTPGNDVVDMKPEKDEKYVAPPPPLLSPSVVNERNLLGATLLADTADPDLRAWFETITSTTKASGPAELRQACEDLLASSKATPELKDLARLHYMMQLCFLSAETEAHVDEAVSHGMAWLETHQEDPLNHAVRTFLATQIAMVDSEALPAGFEERMDMVDAVYRRSKRGPFCGAWFEAEQWHGKALEVLTEKAALERNNRDQAKLYEGVDRKDPAAYVRRQKEINESADLQRQWRLMLAENLRLKQEALKRVLAVYEATNGDAVLVASDLSRAPYGDLSPEVMKLTVDSTAAAVGNTETAIAACQKEYETIMDRESGQVSPKPGAQTP